MPSNTPILMLGVAGLGLSLAMFFDTKKRIKEDEDKLKNKLQEKENQSDMKDNITKVIDIYDMPEENEPEEKALVLDVSFWSMVPYNIVNYVGGWSYRND